MNFRIKKRHGLIMVIAVTQMVCLCWGVWVFSAWLHSSVKDVVQQQVLEDNVQTAKQLIALIQQMKVADLRENPKSWLRLQESVREIRLPNEGFVCVIDAKDGELLCHPALKHAPSSLRQHLQAKQMRAQSSEAENTTMTRSAEGKSMKSLVAMRSSSATRSNDMARTNKNGSTESNAPRPTKKASREINGYVANEGGELQVIAAGYIPDLDANVKVHQKVSGIEKKIAGIMGSVVPLGLTVSVGLVALTTALVFFILLHYDNRLAILNENLENMVDQRTRSLRKTRDSVVFGLAKLAESRDTDTGEHLERIRTYVVTLASHLGTDIEWIDKNYIENLALASSLHDIGKVAIPDRVLLKPGRFEPEERVIMETHAEKGGNCLEAISDHLGEDDFLQLAREIAFSHHEKWDGTGYPFKLAAEEIPFAARIVALADVYDALRSRRPYKEPYSHDRTKQIILDGAGSHFDPLIVQAFVDCESDFLHISEGYQPHLPAIEETTADDNEPVLA